MSCRLGRCEENMVSTILLEWASLTESAFLQARADLRAETDPAGMTLEELSEVMAYMRPTHPQRSEYQRHFAKKRRVFMQPFWRRWHDWADAHTISTSTTARAHDDHVLREAVLKGWKLHTQSPKASPRKAPREAELALGSCAAAGAKPVGTVALSKVSDRPKQAADAPRGSARRGAKPSQSTAMSSAHLGTATRCARPPESPFLDAPTPQAVQQGSCRMHLLPPLSVTTAHARAVWVAGPVATRRRSSGRRRPKVSQSEL